MRSDLSAREAHDAILERTPVLGSETVALPEALGRVLAEPVVSARRIPPADNSAMDGYAVHRADLAGAGPDAPRVLPIAFEIAAGGETPRALPAGSAARILTGAPLPDGADAVVRQEDTERDGDRVAVRVQPPAGEHVRRAGEDVEPGDEVLAAGACVGPAETGMLASLGRGFVAVHQRPRVAILSGGDELVEPDGDVAGGRIVSSNSWSIAAQCRALGAVPVYLGIARDTPASIEARLRGGLAADVIVSSAGVSVGDRDFVRGVLEKLGCRLHFWGVRIKPGYPLAFGSLGDGPPGGGPLVFGLPGNPVSAMMTFEQFARPALLKMTGHRRLHRPTLHATLAEELDKKAGRLHFVRVRLERRGDEVVARTTGNQSSGVLRSMTEANGLLVFPAEATHLPAGERVLVQVLDERFLASDAPGF
ncbi:MAG: gephyrin-like molybdotransferase Glp [Myxococcota bacterium]